MERMKLAYETDERFFESILTGSDSHSIGVKNSEKNKF